MTATDIIKENMATIKGEQSRLAEKLLYELSELSALVYQNIRDDLDGEETVEFFHKYRSEFLASVLADENTPFAYLAALKERGNASYSQSLASFSVFLAERIRADRPTLLPWEEYDGGARITYVHAAMADEVYFALSQMRDGVSVSYSDSARLSVDALRSNRADYAMLPYMSREGELLSGVSRMLDSHDLFIAALVSVTKEDGRLFYVLLSSRVSPFLSMEKMALSFRVTAESFNHLGHMFSAFSAMGFLQTDFVPEREEYGRVCGRVTLTGEGDPLALWAYLSLYSVGFSFLGRYPIIDL